MSDVYFYCAAIGGTLMVLQFLLLLLGAGNDTDVGHADLAHVDLGHADAGQFDHGDAVGHDQGSFLKLLSLQTISTFATFFGLVGLSTAQMGWSPVAVGGASALAGVGALWVVARAMRGLLQLQSSGTLDLTNAIGQPGRVYLRIPAHGDGHGRVQLVVQGRNVECRAKTPGDEIPTGTPIVVIDRQDDDTLVVEPHP